jgi:hypothetical protein
MSLAISNASPKPSARRARGDVDPWRTQARAFCAALEGPLLALYTAGLGGAAAAAARWSEADRALAFQRALALAARVMVRALAESRGLVEPVASPTFGAAATWPVGLATEPADAWLFGPLAAAGSSGGAPPHEADAVATALRDLVRGVPVGFVAVAFESFMARVPRPAPGVGWALGTTRDRREGGVYFTPRPVARFLTERALRPRLDTCRTPADVYALRVVDPAMGGGAFLLEALALLVVRAVDLGETPARARRAVAEACLHGVDVDPRAVTLTRAAVWLDAADPTLPPRALATHLQVGDALFGPAPGEAASAKDALTQFVGRVGSADPAFSWELAFPAVFPAAARAEAGFDVVLGNPPWGKIKAELKEFYTYLDERGRDLQGAALHARVGSHPDVQAEWQLFRAARRRYAARLKAGGGFAAQRTRLPGGRTGGDEDLYKYFLERAFTLLRPGGRGGFVVPAAFYQSEGATGLRRLYFGGAAVDDLLVFENREKHFPIHGMFKYTLLVWERGGAPGVRRARFGLTRLAGLPALLRPAGDEPSFAWTTLTHTGGARLILPEVRNRREQALFEALHTRFVPLGDRATTWNVDFVRELDMTKDHGKFREAAELVRGGAETADGTVWIAGGQRYLPLYEGRLVHQFDHAAKGYTGGDGRRARWEPLPMGTKSVRAHYWVNEDEIGPRAAHVARIRVGFCDITGHANERTALAARIPAGFPCGNKVPTCAFDRADDRLPLLWLAIANSFVVDWLLRRRVSTTLNFFHWKMVPFPRLDPASAEGRALWVAAARLSAIDPASTAASTDVLVAHGEAPATLLDAPARARLRARLDVAVADLYGVDAPALELILADFPLLDRRQPALAGERRSTLTGDLLRATWLDLHGGDASALHARVSAAEARGAVAYVPSEQVGRGERLRADQNPVNPRGRPTP